MPKITVEVVRRYYVEIDGWVYGGPFDTKDEAKECLKQAKKIDTDENEILRTRCG